jgi:uncharacterized SAM-binding protein YcdF (DUF218 family)
MFILSKVLLFLLFPITWVFALLIAALITKHTRRKQRLLGAILVVFYLFSIPALLDAFAKIWRYPAAPVPKNKSYSCAIILGGFSSEKAGGDGYFNAASDRFIQALKLKATGQASHILISSGNASVRPDAFREATWVGQQLKAMQMPDSCVLIENQSRNTLENALYTKQMLIKAHLQPPYLLVTSDFHMRRSMLIFSKTGLDVVPYPCNYSAGMGNFSWNHLMPSSHPFGEWEIYTKELVGYIMAALHKY